MRVVKSRTVRWTGHVARMDEKENAYRVSVRKSEGKRSFGVSGCRFEDNIKMYLKGTGLEVVNWICLWKVRTSGGLL
jgi:hypothetical protein